ncbi:hypothetical protein FLJC2902T_00240 [Flavobacterium limnosediminis JC2902]|uniref:Uncharacterized protein n=1 Tax=Flavobacterium limnosediminis JC2902 TaxID=1341181 RepID=V6SSX8_9FLAO|nr:hypothetical protein FLJC2902T_00240 [Flavobacterium limnosediminis JC2902]
MIATIGLQELLFKINSKTLDKASFTIVYLHFIYYSEETLNSNF